jgi:hypothetical protein
LNCTDFEYGDELGKVNGELEEIEEEFKLIEEHKGDEVDDIIFLVVDCVRNSIVGLGAAVQPNLPLDVHLLASAALAADPPQQAVAATPISSEGTASAAHFRFRGAILIPRSD